jgi:hypothetical protein
VEGSTAEVGIGVGAGLVKESLVTMVVGVVVGIGPVLTSVAEGSTAVLDIVIGAVLVKDNSVAVIVGIEVLVVKGSSVVSVIICVRPALVDVNAVTAVVNVGPALTSVVDETSITGVVASVRVTLTAIVKCSVTVVEDIGEIASVEIAGVEVSALVEGSSIINVIGIEAALVSVAKSMYVVAGVGAVASLVISAVLASTVEESLITVVVGVGAVIVSVIEMNRDSGMEVVGMRAVLTEVNSVTTLEVKYSVLEWVVISSLISPLLSPPISSLISFSPPLAFISL